MNHNMIELKPFFTFFGAKWRVARSYPFPRYTTIIEPFCGSAGYSMRFSNLNVILIEADIVIAEVWEYLIGASESEIRKLPLIMGDECIEDFKIPRPAKSLIGFWCMKGATSPARKATTWMKLGIRPNSFWGEAIRDRIASQIQFIRHWRIIYGNYSLVENQQATWFIDPPYNNDAGNCYRYGKKSIDYISLAEWCRSRSGQTIVCENKGADWLPFETHRRIKGNSRRALKGYSEEVIWTNE